MSSDRRATGAGAEDRELMILANDGAKKGVLSVHYQDIGSLWHSL